MSADSGHGSDVVGKVVLAVVLFAIAAFSFNFVSKSIAGFAERYGWVTVVNPAAGPAQFDARPAQQPGFVPLGQYPAPSQQAGQGPECPGKVTDAVFVRNLPDGSSVWRWRNIEWKMGPKKHEASYLCQNPTTKNLTWQNPAGY